MSMLFLSTSCKRNPDNNNTRSLLRESTTFEFKNKFRDNDQLVTSGSYLLKVRSHDDKKGIFDTPCIL